VTIVGVVVVLLEGVKVLGFWVCFAIGYKLGRDTL
jgi:hypothetical protein